jgi:hypothetical protein
VDSLQFHGDPESLLLRVVFDGEHVRLATDLAVFEIPLAAAGGLIAGRVVPPSESFFQ